MISYCLCNTFQYFSLRRTVMHCAEKSFVSIILKYFKLYRNDSRLNGFDKQKNINGRASSFASLSSSHCHIVLCNYFSFSLSFLLFGNPFGLSLCFQSSTSSYLSFFQSPISFPLEFLLFRIFVWHFPSSFENWVATLHFTHAFFCIEFWQYTVETELTITYE